MLHNGKNFSGTACNRYSDHVIHRDVMEDDIFFWIWVTNVLEIGSAEVQWRVGVVPNDLGKAVTRARNSLNEDTLNPVSKILYVYHAHTFDWT